MPHDAAPHLPSPALHDRLMRTTNGLPDPYLRVDCERQMLYLVKNHSLYCAYPVSTSQYGIGNREGSFQTPPGIHRVAEKYGRGAPRFRIFRDREDTGIDWQEGMERSNLVLTRILRLEGLEPGLNRGHGIDSFERYIYIHGTNKEDRIGTPLSHGCIVMRNDDIITLFDTVPEGTIVIID
jgi:lipoprotein-anchoring transpeptidase ErfK/SrfK